MRNLLRFNFIYNLFWKIRCINKFEVMPLCLVFGVGRSGTTWIANTLAKTETPIRYLEEPLYSFRPNLRLRKSKFDELSIPYNSKNAIKNRFIKAYEIITSTMQIEKHLLGRVIKRNDINFEKVLIKEVHSFFGLKLLIENPNNKILLVQRNAKKIIDSTANIHKRFNYPILTEEYIEVLNSEFIENEFPELKDEINMILVAINNVSEFEIRILCEKYLVTSILNKWYLKLAQENVNVLCVSYEDMLVDSDLKFGEISHFFKLNYEKGAYDFSNEEEIKHKAYSITKNTQNQIKKDFYYLTKEQSSKIDLIFKNLK